MSPVTHLHWSQPEAWHPAPATARQVVARGLHGASVMLARLAQRLATPRRRTSSAEARLEFHAEAGAPEGALYLDGRLVGWLQGVKRL